MWLVYVVLIVVGWIAITLYRADKRLHPKSVSNADVERLDSQLAEVKARLTLAEKTVNTSAQDLVIPITLKGMGSAMVPVKDLSPEEQKMVMWMEQLVQAQDELATIALRDIDGPFFKRCLLLDSLTPSEAYALLNQDKSGDKDSEADSDSRKGPRTTA